MLLWWQRPDRAREALPVMITNTTDPWLLQKPAVTFLQFSLSDEVRFEPV